MTTTPVSPLPPTVGKLETILASFDTNYVWNYANVKEGLADLYEKAKREQWNSTTDLDWNIQVDPEAEIIPQVVNPLVGFAPYEKLNEKERIRLRHAQIALQLSQFLHGEQGALIVASQLVGGVPWMDAKFYAGTQTMDEARHVEVFSRYVHEKLEWEWPITPSLKELLDATITDSRWDFKYLGMQIIIEGLAMAAFASLFQMCREPLLKTLLQRVMRDESRHVAFGVLSLRDHYAEMPEREREEREEFIIFACDLMRNRLVGDHIADAMGWNREDLRNHVRVSQASRAFQKFLFARIVPNLKKLGLLTPRVREAFQKLDIIQFEDFDPTEADRRL
ncbi:MAG: ferritin-like domain-containing protein, partial [Myxococcota bacterium]